MWTYIYNTDNTNSVTTFNMYYSNFSSIIVLYFFTQKQETQQHYQLRTKTYYLILKEKILLKIKNTTQKILSI